MVKVQILLNSIRPVMYITFLIVMQFVRFWVELVPCNEREILGFISAREILEGTNEWLKKDDGS